MQWPDKGVRACMTPEELRLLQLLFRDLCRLQSRGLHRQLQHPGHNGLLMAGGSHDLAQPTTRSESQL